MKETTRIDENAVMIKDYIKRLGFMPEHKFEYYKCLTDEGTPSFVYDDDFGVLCYLGSEGKHKVITSLVEPLAKKDMIESIFKFITYSFESKKLDKVILETRHETRLELIKRLKGTKYRVLPERYHLTWPVFNMANFDETLTGSKWKKMRYYKTKFFKDYNPEIIDYNPSYNEDLVILVKSWVKRRTAKDIAAYERYLNMIKSNFDGFDMVKMIKVDGRIVSVFGGWKIVNSENYYSCIGIYDYNITNIGDVSNILDLTNIKELGVKKADFGGGEEALTNFKKKLFPDEFYRTDIYTVKKWQKNSNFLN